MRRMSYMHVLLLYGSYWQEGKLPFEARLFLSEDLPSRLQMCTSVGAAQITIRDLFEQVRIFAAH